MGLGAGGGPLRPSFVAYLAGILFLPVKWLSPFSYAQAGWCDVAFAVSAALVLVEVVRRGRWPRPRPVHVALAAYLIAVGLSGLATSEPRSTSAQNVLISLEMVALALLSSYFASEPGRRRLLARAVLVVVGITALEAFAGLGLFYLGHRSSLVDSYSSYFGSSKLYTRVDGGFYSPPLLGNFTIFASAVVDWEAAGLSSRRRVALQIVLGLLALSTISRPLIGFIVALGIREAHRRRDALRARRLTIALVAAGAAVSAALTFTPLSVDPLRPASSVDSANPRFVFLRTAAHTFAHHPLLGIGPGALPGRWQGAPYRAHFTPLNVAATTGILSLAALGAVAVLLWRRRRSGGGIALWSGLIGLGLDGLTQDVEHFRQLWIMLGLIDGSAASRSRRLAGEAQTLTGTDAG